MPGQLRCGAIVWTEIADANGIRKVRPAVVITTDDQISAVDLLEVVAITSFLPDPLPDDYVLLPWHAQGHPRTGLNRESAAVCSWMAMITPQDVQNVVGQVPGPIFSIIVSKLPGRQTP